MNGPGQMENKKTGTAADRGVLRLKSFFAPTVEIAVAQARMEFGPDALLIDSHPAPPEASHLGRYEVVFAAGEPVAPTRKALPPPAERAEADLVSSLNRISSQLSELSALVLRKTPQDLLSADSACAREAIAALMERGVGRDTAEQITGAVIDRLGQSTGGEAHRGLRRLGAIGPASAAGSSRDVGSMFRAELEAELASRVRVLPALGIESGETRIVALVGPPGAGKTTTIAKLAFQYGVRARLSVHLLSLDTVRIAGTEQLRACAAIMGIGFQALSTPAALAQALAEHRTKALVLIDTPGAAACDTGEATELARVLSRPDIDIHLVMAASMAPAAMDRAADRFDLFRPNKLIFSKVDEIDDYGACYELALKTGAPVSFLSTGPRLPEDLAEATREWLVGSLFRNWPEAALSAA